MEQLKKLIIADLILRDNSINDFANPNRSKKKSRNQNRNQTSNQNRNQTSNQDRNQTNNPNFAVYGYAN